MKKHHPYNSIVERKLAQLPVEDADTLWNDMHGILDKKMPKEKARRRFIFWFFAGGTLALMTVAINNFTKTSVLSPSEKETAFISNKNSNKSTIPETLIENNEQGNLISLAANDIVDKKWKQEKGDVIPGIKTQPNAFDFVAGKRATTRQQRNESGKNIIEEEFYGSIGDLVKTKTEFHITPLTIGSVRRSLIGERRHRTIVGQRMTPGQDNFKQKRNPVTENEKGFYAGFMSGVDMSSIRMKNVRTGSTAGFIVGYSLNKRWSIESGMLWDTKRIYDDGKYFSPPGYIPTTGITITAVNGKSRIYEFPLNVKYSITTGKNKLFATAGVSSYIMRSENYDYRYEQNNQPGGHNYLTYKNVTKDLVSVGNITVGYTHKIGNSGSLRIEPYLKLPLKDIGLGDMPIMSTGLNVGFVKKLK